MPGCFRPCSGWRWSGPSPNLKWTAHLQKRIARRGMTSLARHPQRRTLKTMKRFLTLTPFLGFALFTALFLCSCHSNSEVMATGLEVEVTGVTQARDGSAAVTWQIKNTNVVSYLFSQISQQVSLNGTPLGSVVEKDPLPLPPGSSAGRTTKLATLDAAASRALS